jgi:diguanylate cyclase (GGDEF)-like protein/PAS domain S-box-containing protein
MHCPATIVVTDAEGIIEYVNATFGAVTGYAASEAIGKTTALLKSGEMPEQHYRELWLRLGKGQDWIGEFHNRRKDGGLYWERATISAVRDAAGKVEHYLKIAEDITLRKQLEADLKASYESLKASKDELQATCKELQQATRALRKSERALQRLSQEDALTGLLNRRGLDVELRRVQALAERQGYGIGMLIIDLDHFKRINDQFGHAAGDRVLKGCAALLRSHLRASDLICRYGGDELVVVLPSADATTTRRTAERILKAVRQQEFRKGRTRLPVTVSIGAACASSVAGASLEQALKQADQALYQAKHNGRDGMAFCPAGSFGVGPR